MYPILFQSIHSAIGMQSETAGVIWNRKSNDDIYITNHMYLFVCV